MDAIREHLASGQREVYDADLKSYFDTIPHDQLLKALRMRITDRSVLHSDPLVAGSADRRIGRPGPQNGPPVEQGTPQGGVISPLLANVYLHWFEQLFHRPDGPGTWAKARTGAVRG